MRGSASLPLRLAERRLSLLAGDILALALAGMAAVAAWSWVRPNAAPATTLIAGWGRWLLVQGAAWLVLLAAAGGYDLRLAARPREMNRRLLGTALAFAVGYLALFFAFSRPPVALSADLSPLRGVPLLRVVPTFFVGLALAAELAWRNAYALLLTGKRFSRRTLVIGAGWSGETIVAALRRHGSGCHQLLGFVDDDPAKQGRVVAEARAGSPALRVLGDRHALRDLIAELGVSTLILAITHEMDGELLSVLVDCLALGVEIVPMPVLYEELTGRVPVEHVGESWYVALPISHPGTGTLWPLTKRLIDILLGSLGLAFLGLLLPPLALAIYLDSPGPIFYSQERVGQGGRRFRVHKLRSMVVDAEKAGAQWAGESDGRVTRVGRLLRKSHVDEFPQFWNIVKGEMSVVGPRPERPEFVAALAEEIPFYRLRHAVKPGAAGWALVKQGYSASKADALLKLQFDLYYIKHQSLLLDLTILLQTAAAMLTLKGR